MCMLIVVKRHCIRRLWVGSLSLITLLRKLLSLVMLEHRLSLAVSNCTLAMRQSVVQQRSEALHYCNLYVTVYGTCSGIELVTGNG